MGPPKCLCSQFFTVFQRVFRGGWWGHSVAPARSRLALSPVPSHPSPTGDGVLVHFPPCADGPLGGHVLAGLLGAHPPRKVPQQPGTFQLPGECPWTSSLLPDPCRGSPDTGAVDKGVRPEDVGSMGTGSPGCQAGPRAQSQMVQVRKPWSPESGHVQGPKQNKGRRGTRPNRRERFSA